jgi:hypothetical protein
MLADREFVMKALLKASIAIVALAFATAPAGASVIADLSELERRQQPQQRESEWDMAIPPGNSRLAADLSLDGSRYSARGMQPAGLGALERCRQLPAWRIQG